MTDTTMCAIYGPLITLIIGVIKRRFQWVENHTRTAVILLSTLVAVIERYFAGDGSGAGPYVGCITLLVMAAITTQELAATHVEKHLLPVAETKRRKAQKN